MWLYHVTYLFHLESIARDGLVPGSGANFSEGYREYAGGWLFLTEGSGVSFWASRLEEHAESKTDHPEEGWVPITLSFEISDDLVLVEDTIGSSDASADAWKTKGRIAPEDIYFWDGADWQTIDEANEENLLEEVLEASDHECEEDDPENCWWNIEYDYFLPPDEELEDEP